MPSELDELQRISFKLDQMLLLLKMANKGPLDEARAKIQGDKTAAKILELCSQPISYTDLTKQVASQTAVAEVTVRRRISELKDSGVLVSNRQGKEVFYVDSGLVS